MSRDLDELLELSDRIVVMSDPRLVHQAPVARAAGVVISSVAWHPEAGHGRLRLPVVNWPRASDHRGPLTL